MAVGGITADGGTASVGLPAGEEIAAERRCGEGVVEGRAGCGEGEEGEGCGDFHCGWEGWGVGDEPD